MRRSEFISRIFKTPIFRPALLLALFLSLQTLGYSQSDLLFVQVTALGGRTFKTGETAKGFDLAVGSGKNMISVGFEQEPLGSYALGIGRSINPTIAQPVNTASYPLFGFGNSNIDGYVPVFYPVPNSISGSSLTDISAHFRRDLYGIAHDRVVAYGTVGVGFLQSRYKTVYQMTCVSYFGGPGSPQIPTACPAVAAPTDQFNNRVALIGLEFGAGVRFALTKRIGFQAEWNLRKTGGGTPALSGSGPFPPAQAGTPIGSDKLATATVGFYYRWFTHHI